MDNPLPLNQVPETCGYTTMKRNLGLVLNVSYDGCNVIQEKWNIALKMRCFNASRELVDESELIPVRTWRLNCHRRHAAGQLYNDPNHQFNYYYTWYTSSGLIYASYPADDPGERRSLVLRHNHWWDQKGPLRSEQSHVAKTEDILKQETHYM